MVADVHTVCFSLGRKAFTELLGPIEDVWRFEALRKVCQRQAGVACRLLPSCTLLHAMIGILHAIIAVVWPSLLHCPCARC